MTTKDQSARLLAAAHRQLEPGISRIIRLMADNESDASEPVKLLEVNPATPRYGIVPVVFSPDPPDIPFPSVVVEVTESEFVDIQENRLALPAGWHMGEILVGNAV